MSTRQVTLDLFEKQFFETSGLILWSREVIRSCRTINIQRSIRTKQLESERNQFYGALEKQARYRQQLIVCLACQVVSSNGHTVLNDILRDLASNDEKVSSLQKQLERIERTYRQIKHYSDTIYQLEECLKENNVQWFAVNGRYRQLWRELRNGRNDDIRVVREMETTRQAQIAVEKTQADLLDQIECEVLCEESELASSDVVEDLSKRKRLNTDDFLEHLQACYYKSLP